MKEKFIVLRAKFDAFDRFCGWVEVGPAHDVEDAKRRYTPLQYGYAVTLQRARS